MPKINKDSNCDLAFKLMNENSLDKLLVEDNNKNIIGVIDENSWFEAVMANSFSGKIKNFINTNVKKVDYFLGIKKLIVLFEKENFVFVYKNKKFFGMITKNDLLSYLKRNPNDW